MAPLASIVIVGAAAIKAAQLRAIVIEKGSKNPYIKLVAIGAK